MKKNYYSAAFLILFIIFNGCGKSADNHTEKSSPKIDAVKSVKLDIAWDMVYPAQITGSSEVEIKSQINGILQKQLYKEGQYVKEGTLLFTIDPEKYKIALRRAQAVFTKSELELKKAQKDQNKIKVLEKRKAISQKEVNDSLLVYEKIEETYQKAKDSFETAKSNFEYSNIKAPISGIVRKENYSQGSSISSDAVLTTMVQTNPLHVNFSLPAGQLIGLNNESEEQTSQVPKIKVEILFSNGTKYKDSAEIIFVDSVQDSKTSSVAVKAKIQNSVLSKDLMPGRFVRVKLIDLTFKGASVIPASALISTAEGYIVYTVSNDGNNIVEQKKVTAGIKDSVAVIYSGLEGTETVIISKSLKIKPGIKVNPNIQDFILPEDLRASYEQQYLIPTSSATAVISTQTASE